MKQPEGKKNLVENMKHLPENRAHEHVYFFFLLDNTNTNTSTEMRSFPG